MAWVNITNNTGYQYNNAPTMPDSDAADHKLWALGTAGIRTNGSSKVYSNVRKAGTTKDIGEMSKSFWDKG